MAAARRFFRPSLATLTLPILLVVFAFVGGFTLRVLLYHPLSVPLQPLIDRLGWVYIDKPHFLTPGAARLTAVCWAAVIYIAGCAIRWCVRSARKSGVDNKMNPID